MGGGGGGRGGSCASLTRFVILWHVRDFQLESGSLFATLRSKHSLTDLSLCSFHCPTARTSPKSFQPQTPNPAPNMHTPQSLPGRRLANHHVFVLCCAALSCGRRVPFSQVFYSGSLEAGPHPPSPTMPSTSNRCLTR